MSIKTFKDAFDSEAAKRGKDFGKYYVSYILKDENDPYPLGQVVDLKTGQVKTTAYKGYLDVHGKRYLWHEKTSKDLRNAILYMQKIHKDMHSLAYSLYESWFDDEYEGYQFYEFNMNDIPAQQKVEEVKEEVKVEEKPKKKAKKSKKKEEVKETIEEVKIEEIKEETKE